MKPSHTQTPRTLADAVFYTNSDPIERFERETKQQGQAIRFAAAAVFAACLAIALWPNNANAQLMSGAVLAQHLNAPEQHMRTAAGYYIAGVFDAYSGVTHCAPATVGVETVLPLGAKFVLANPQYHDKPADVLLNTVFQQAWPCPKRSSV